MSSQSPAGARHEPVLSYVGVVHLYESLLRRTPSQAEVEGQLAATTDWQILLSAIVASDEFAAQKPAEPSITTPTVNIWHPEFSAYTHRAGRLSVDASTLVGLDGWLFLIRGSNSVFEQYQSSFDPGDAWESTWSEIVSYRTAEASRLGVEIGLLIVPDKLSVMHEYLPQPYSLETLPPAATLASRLGITYPLAELQAVEGGAFLRTDTHLSLPGNHVLASSALSALGISQPAPAVDAMPVANYASSGDLGQNMSPPVIEIMSSYNSLGSAHVAEDNLDSMRAAGRHVGTRRVYENPHAIDSRTAVIFGDSYSFGAPGYQGIAWFFAQHFRKVHFIWSPFGWDSEYVVASGATVVLCEMAERFVPRPPKLAINATDLAQSSTAPDRTLQD